MRLHSHRSNHVAVAVLAAGVLLAPAVSAQAQDHAKHKKGRQKMTSTAIPGERILAKKAVVDAPLAEVWHAWTTSEGIKAFWGVESNIELEIGGPYELFMGMTEPDESGTRGSEGCRVLSYIPMEMVSFEWNFPPAVPTLRNAHAKTFIVLRFEAAGDRKTRVRLYQLGWQDGEDWDKGYTYFDRAWSFVLDLLKKNAGSLAKPKVIPTPEKAKDESAARTREWADDDVKVRARTGPEKRQDFEVELPASVPVVWHALATADGMKHVFGTEGAEIELRPGGKYGTWPGAPNKVMSYLPDEMLSTSGSAPEQFPNVRKGGTWSAYFLKPIGKNKTQLRLVTLGWRDGDKEWDEAYEYFLKNNAIYLNQLKKRLAAVEGK